MMANRAGDFPSLDPQAFRRAARQAWIGGARPDTLKRLFSQNAEELLASNAGGGVGQPSPYTNYFSDPANFGALIDQLGPGGAGRKAANPMSYADFLASNPGGSLQDFYQVAGPGLQQDFFEANPGLRASYLASLGVADVGGRITDPRNPRLTPYAADQRYGQNYDVPAGGVGAPVRDTPGPQAPPVGPKPNFPGQTPPIIPGQTVPTPQAGSHRMPDGTTMAGATHPADAGGASGAMAQAQQLQNQIAQLPLDPAFEATRRILNDRLQAVLGQIPGAREQLAAQQRVATGRLDTDADLARRQLLEAMNSRGILNSSITGNELSTLATGFGRQRQDLAAAVAEGLGQISNTESGAYLDYSQGLQEALLELANRTASDPYAAVDRYGARRPNRRRPRRRRRR